MATFSGESVTSVGRIASWASCAPARLAKKFGFSGNASLPNRPAMNSRQAATATGETRVESVRM